MYGVIKKNKMRMDLKKKKRHCLNDRKYIKVILCTYYEGIKISRCYKSNENKCEKKKESSKK